MKEPTWQSDDGSIRLHNADCREAMRGMEANSIDSIVTDPPYGLSFMGKGWDHGIPGVEFWTEALRVAKPGAHLLAFGGTRTFHRLTCAIEDAGWEIRDCIMWVYGSGFPKSLDVSKAIDKAAGAERERVAGSNSGGMKSMNSGNHDKGYRPEAYYETGNNLISSEAITESAKQWQGWGTALKPSWEPIIVARKPIVGTVAANVLQFGTGGINVDGCRVETNPEVDDPRLGGKGDWSSDKMAKNVYEGGYAGERVGSSPLGRWPANLIHDGCWEVVELFPITTSGTGAKQGASSKGYSPNAYGSESRPAGTPCVEYGDTGSAARFFYCAKASRADRNEGLADMPEKPLLWSSGTQNPGSFQSTETNRASQNNHPTVKPTVLMRYLCRLVTPAGRLVLDPFMGSGSTGKAALLEGFQFVGCESDTEHGYFDVAKERTHRARQTVTTERAKPKQANLFDGATP